MSVAHRSIALTSVLQRDEGHAGKIKNAQGLIILSVNDPSAGSPTETLLRLLLPLNAQV